jgi:hypothetical protein
MDKNKENWWSNLYEFMIGMIMNGEKKKGWGWKWGMKKVNGEGMEINCEENGGM